MTEIIEALALVLFLILVHTSIIAPFARRKG